MPGGTSLANKTRIPWNAELAVESSDFKAIRKILRVSYETGWFESLIQAVSVFKSSVGEP
jgi:hypothetical protein